MYQKTLSIRLVSYNNLSYNILRYHAYGFMVARQLSYLLSEMCLYGMQALDNFRY